MSCLFALGMDGWNKGLELLFFLYFSYSQSYHGMEVPEDLELFFWPRRYNFLLSSYLGSLIWMKDLGNRI